MKIIKAEDQNIFHIQRGKKLEENREVIKIFIV